MIAEPSKLLKASCENDCYCYLGFAVLETVIAVIFASWFHLVKQLWTQIDEGKEMTVVATGREVAQGHGIQTGSLFCLGPNWPNSHTVVGANRQ